MKLDRGCVTVVAVAIALSSCSGGDEVAVTRTAATDLAAADDELFDVPEAARATNGGGQPRSAAYWVRWSACGADNRADVAAANGGREMGWFLVDDLLADPGIDLGDQPVVTCESALEVLEADVPDSWDLLARQLLAAELSFNSGSENCDIAEQSAAAAHVVLSRSLYGGPGSIAGPLDDVSSRLVGLLGRYVSGDLCR